MIDGSYVVFSIDNSDDPSVVARFMRFLDTHRVMGHIDTYRHCIGMYKGNLELSWAMRTEDYKSMDHSWMKNQECILAVPTNPAGPATLWDVDMNVRKGLLQPMVVVLDPHDDDAWTYDIKSGKYYVC